jgi:hypothetical protein
MPEIQIISFEPAWTPDFMAFQGILDEVLNTEE